ncbi:glutathione S-transferase N-terminal domain-containing protein [Fulvimarina endophytica]|nr:glutathione S-transferase N-terminal domain-containing protein [Fulvimarina endophytica]
MKLFKNATSPFARLAHAMLIEAGADLEIELVNQWESPERLVERNPAQRIPTLELDDGTILTEALLIADHAARIAPDGSHLKATSPQEAQITGIAFGVFDAAVYTLNGRMIVSGSFTDTAFDDQPMGLRRRRSMTGGIARLDALADRLSTDRPGLAEIATVTAVDYLRLRFPGAGWLTIPDRLSEVSRAFADRPSLRETAPPA